jgi:hypothetical protein
MPIAAAYAGINIGLGNSVAEAINSIPTVLNIAASPVKYAVDQMPTLLSVPSTKLNKVSEWYVPSKVEGGLHYKFFKSIIGADAAFKWTKALGTIGTSMFGHGVVTQGLAYATVPVWGATIAPIVGSALAVWGANKAYKFAKGTYGRFFKVGAVQRQEKANLTAQKWKYEQENKDVEAQVVGMAIDQLPGRISETREKMSEKEKTNKRKRNLQSAVALKV